MRAGHIPERVFGLRRLGSWVGRSQRRHATPEGAEHHPRERGREGNRPHGHTLQDDEAQYASQDDPGGGSDHRPESDAPPRALYVVRFSILNTRVLSLLFHTSGLPDCAFPESFAWTSTRLGKGAKDEVAKGCGAPLRPPTHSHEGDTGGETMHTMTDRLGDVGDRLRERRSNSKVEHLDRENDRLRVELRSARSLLDQERSDRDEILDALKGRPKTVVKKKRGGLIRMVVIGGGAYVLGTRAGRARYEQIVDWAKRMKDRGRDATDDFRSDVVSAANGEMTPREGSPADPIGSAGSATTGSTVSTKVEKKDVGSAKPSTTGS